jgi:glycine betaine/proline transport system substrate-binding protein
MAGFSAAAWAQDKVTIGVPNWPSVKITANVIKIIAEENFGTNVELVPGTNAVIFKAMDRAKGDVDVHPEVWMPNQANLAAEYVKKKKSVVMSGRPYAAVQGVCVNKVANEKHGVKSVNDLVNPDVSALFDSNGDGKGELWVGAPGWASTNIEKVKARGYGYDQFFELTTIEETLVLAQLDDAVAKKRPFVFFCYGPHHMFQLHELVQLEEPTYDESKWKMVQPTDDPDWFNKSSIDVAWPPTKVHIAYSKTLETRAPNVAQLLSNIQMNSALVSAWTYALVVDKHDAAEYAKKWVAENTETVNKWLGL